MTNIKFAFLGSSDFSVHCLETMKALGLLPSLIVTMPGKPKGRGLVVQDNIVKTWAEKNNLPVITLDKTNSTEVEEALKKSDVALVASFGKIINEKILNAPGGGVLNIHPSLLPKYRGPSPLQAQILNDEKKLGVTIIKLDQEVDHGPIIAKESFSPTNWPINYEEFEALTAEKGSNLFAMILANYAEGKITPVEQNHAEATFTNKYEKADVVIDLTAEPYENYLKFCAFTPMLKPRFYAETTKGKILVIITKAKYENSEFKILRVIPEGKKEMLYEDFLRGLTTKPPCQGA